MLIGYFSLLSLVVIPLLLTKLALFTSIRLEAHLSLRCLVVVPFPCWSRRRYFQYRIGGAHLAVLALHNLSAAGVANVVVLHRVGAISLAAVTPQHLSGAGVADVVVPFAAGVFEVAVQHRVDGASLAGVAPRDGSAADVADVVVQNGFAHPLAVRWYFFRLCSCNCRGLVWGCTCGGCGVRFDVCGRIIGTGSKGRRRMQRRGLQ